jgi:hypothetical protein
LVLDSNGGGWLFWEDQIYQFENGELTLVGGLQLRAVAAGPEGRIWALAGPGPDAALWVLEAAIME